MYIYLQYHGKYTKDIGTTKTFDSCVYVTEVSFSLVFKLRSLSRCMSERARRKCSQQTGSHPRGERTSEDLRAEL
ncbi:hypothetical protein ALC60_13654 [Trachymyrmex zeteki]|uniref:Uncharacterized protein n=1 Tax=Mycetomoellerius zeteki TaxID=64791 RepID=A0A151WHK7_9HYME|nr:hypothetical protein ALC60_13654 [Trachymyrmex zeteki]